ncbi:actin filament-associated protein 1-like 1 isoform X2 [Arapaima gigas]
MDTSTDSAMEHLMKELNILLKMLDQEKLSSATTEKKTAVGNLLKQLKPSVNGTDYIYVNTTQYGNGTSFVESLFKEFEFQDLKNAEKPESQEKNSTPESLPSQLNPEGPPPLPTTPPPEDYYEEADPLSPDKVPQYITTPKCSSPLNSTEDGYYEDADENYPSTQINGPHKSSDNDSDALSTSYESYDEEEDEAKARLNDRWPMVEDMSSAKDCRMCAFLLRKKRFGQWTKQLTLIRDNRLQCFKKSKDHTPHVDLPLDLCNVIYVPKDGRRKKHELRFSLPGGEALVLAVQSKEQAEDWLKVIREVSSQGNVNYGTDGSTSPMILRKLELEQGTLPQRLSADKHPSDSDSVATGDSVSPCYERDSRIHGKVKRGTLSELTGSMGRVAGRKITQIISFPRKKPPLPRDPLKVHHSDRDPRCGYLRVLTDQGWKERWCCVREGSLSLLRSREGPHTHIGMLTLSNCEVVPGLSPKHPFAFRILREGKELATLEASCSEEMGRWLGVLLAATGSATDPDVLHYDYVDVDTIASIQDAVRHSFLWATSSSSSSTDPKAYDEVSYEGIQPGAERGQKPGSHGKHVTQRFGMKATGKDQTCRTNHYGRYGKTRAEEDARRYLREKEELEQAREGIRSALLSLRKEKREVREGLKSVSGEQVKLLEQRLSQLEESCREKEGERVDLELRLTEVKENLKKSLAGGMLGAPQESNLTSKVQLGKKHSRSSEASLTAICNTEVCKTPLSMYTPNHGNVMQKAKEWESKKGT